MSDKTASELSNQISDAKNLLACGEYIQVEKILKQLLSEDVELGTKERYEAMTLKADVLFATKDYSEAERYYKEVIVFVTDAFGSEDPYLVHPLMRMGKLCKLDGDLDASEEFFLVAIAIYENNPDFVMASQGVSIYRELASLQIQYRNDLALALGYLNSLEDLLRSEPDSEENQQVLGEALLSKVYCAISLGHEEEATKVLDAMMHLESSSDDTRAFMHLFSGLHAHVFKRESLIDEHLQSAQGLLSAISEEEKESIILTFLTAHSVGMGRDKLASEFAIQAAKLLDLHTSFEGENDHADTEHLKEAGFHMVSEISESDAALVRELLLTQAEAFASQKQYLFAHFIITYLLRASLSIRGDGSELEEKLNAYTKKIPAFAGLDGSASVVHTPA